MEKLFFQKNNMLKKVNNHKYEAFKYTKGSNQYIMRVKTGNDKPRLRAGLCALVMFGFGAYYATNVIERAISATPRVAENIYSTLSRNIENTFTTVAYAPRFTAYASPLAKTQTPNSVTILSHEQYIHTKSHGDIILRIWNNESSEGKAPFLYCSNRDQTNEFGFGVTLKTPICFKTFEDSVDAVNNWFDVKLQSMSLAQALRLYSGSDNSYINSFLNK